MHHPQFRNPNWQFPVRVQVVFVNHHVVWAVHWTQDEHFPISHIHWWEHVIMIVVPVTGSLVQVHIRHDWCINVLVPETDFFVYDVAFDNATDCSAFWQPEWQTRTHFRRNHKEIQFFAQFPVIPFFGFFPQTDEFFQVFLIKEGCTVHPLHHMVVGIAPPISSCHR